MTADFNPPDKDLWNDLRRAVGEVAMSISAHNHVQKLFESVEAEANARAIRRQKEQAENPANP